MGTAITRLFGVALLGLIAVPGVRADWVADWFYDDINSKLSQQFEELREEQIKRRLEVVQFNIDIAHARQAFWATFPDQPGHAQAKARFAELLHKKDMEQLFMEVLFGAKSGVNEVMTTDINGSAIPSDGGIPQYAKPSFDRWAKCVRMKMLELNGIEPGKPAKFSQILTLGLYMLPATIACAEEHRFYLSRRNWSEFVAAEREQDYYASPAVFVKFWMEDDRAVRSGTSLNEEDLRQSLDCMAQLYGADLLAKTSAKLVSIKKDTPGQLSSTDCEALGLPPDAGHMIRAFRDLLAADSPHTALISALWELNINDHSDVDFRVIRRQLTGLEYLYGSASLDAIGGQLQSPKIVTRTVGEGRDTYVMWRYQIGDDVFESRADLFAA